jgi:beta-ribofuranosylaminobenzene 5'-phosphate synthase
MSTLRHSADNGNTPPNRTAAPRRVTVTTGCRLHFGLLSHGGGTEQESVAGGHASACSLKAELQRGDRAAGGPSAAAELQGRRFGGAGVMLESPGVELVFEQAAVWSVSGPEPGRRRIEQFAARYRKQSRAERWKELAIRPMECRIELRREIPPHAGLGSGTQLALAVARGLALLDGEGELPATELARRVGRGARSAVGIHGFEQGGFIVDGGQGDADEIGVLVRRVPFPSEWRFVLITPPDESGLSGPAEKIAFDRLPPMPVGLTAELRRLLLAELLPAVATADFERCGEALFQFNRRVGESFAAIQGGVFANPRMAELAETLRAAGIRGVGQTSWGPTLFALVRDAHEAERLRADAARDENCRGCRLHVAAPKNESPRVELTV